MDIREFKYYQYLAEQGYVEALKCIDDPEHGSLFGNIDSDDKLYLYCVACNYKLKPGLALTDRIRREIKEVSNDRI